MWRGAQVLIGPCHRSPQCLCGVQRPIRIAQNFASEQDQVGLPTAYDVIGLGGRGDQANSGRWQASLVAYARGERRLEARTGRDYGVWYQSAG